MPIFEYQCKSCDSTYDVYHKVREVIEDVVCPACGSEKHKRLISAPRVSMGMSRSPENLSASSCDTGGCCGGSCNVN